MGRRTPTHLGDGETTVNLDVPPHPKGGGERGQNYWLCSNATTQQNNLYGYSKLAFCKGQLNQIPSVYTICMCIIQGLFPNLKVKIQVFEFVSYKLAWCQILNFCQKWAWASVNMDFFSDKHCSLYPIKNEQQSPTFWFGLHLYRFLTVITVFGHCLHFWTRIVILNLLCFLLFTCFSSFLL